jgi:putative membrane protein
MIEQMIEQCTEMMKHMSANMADGHMMDGGMMGGMMGGGMMGGMMGTMILGTLLLLALFAIGVVLLMRLGRNDTNRTSSAMRILQERFAHGEIDLEEYQERKSVLQS